MSKTPVGSITPFGLRMQPELKEKLETLAGRLGRSLNAEIVARLEKSLLDDDGTQDTLDEHGEHLEEIDDKIDQLEDEISRLKTRMTAAFSLLRGTDPDPDVSNSNDAQGDLGFR